MTDNKILMVKLDSGSFVRRHGSGHEKYNLERHIDGKYYGLILNSGYPHNISLEQYR